MAQGHMSKIEMQGNEFLVVLVGAGILSSSLHTCENRAVERWRPLGRRPRFHFCVVMKFRATWHEEDPAQQSLMLLSSYLFNLHVHMSKIEMQGN